MDYTQTKWNTKYYLFSLLIKCKNVHVGETYKLDILHSYKLNLII